jgi:diguanylate cyclase (GGDEF)-like protein
MSQQQHETVEFPRSTSADDALFAFLVDSIHAARATLAASVAMAMLTTLAAFEVTGAPIFLAHAAAHVVIGAGRWNRVHAHEARPAEARNVAFIARCDRAFAFWSALYALTLGLTCYELTALAPQSCDIFALGLSMCTGYTLAFVTRSAGRPWTLRLQVAGVSAPQVVALLTHPIPHGFLYAGLVVGLAGAALEMGRNGHARIVALYRADDANRRLAETDMLTGLMNRFAVTKAFARAVAQAERLGGALAVFLIDLDRFKEINDTLGHAAGDAVLVETARRLREAAPQAVTARMGGDEFMLIAPLRDAKPQAVDALGESLIASLSRPILIDGAAAPVGASVGAAVWPEQGRDIAELMKHADCALYESKREGRGRLRLFDDSLRDRLAAMRLLARELDEAMRGDQLEVWYQPIHSLGGGGVCGYEALVRWRHPTHGLVPPDRFVPLAEQNGSIDRLGEIVLDKACQEAAGWDRRLSVAVNLSPQQFRRPEPLVQAVKQALARSGLEPWRLYLEITESFLMEDTPATRKAINELAAHGVKFSLDDFGAGYSSLSYIQNYPFSKIKIDRKFVENISTDRVSSAVVASVCVLAERIHVSVVAEGVETLAQSQALAALGVDLAQGYLYGRPARMAKAPVLKLVG